MGKLTVAKVKSITNPGRYGDGGTLFLFVKPSGSKSWVQRLTIHGVRRDIGLGWIPLGESVRSQNQGICQSQARQDRRRRSAGRETQGQDADIPGGRRESAQGKPGALAGGQTR